MGGMSARRNSESPAAAMEHTNGGESEARKGPDLAEESPSARRPCVLLLRRSRSAGNDGLKARPYQPPTSSSQDMADFRVLHQDVLKLNDAQGLNSLISFIRHKATFREHGYKNGDGFVMPPFSGEHVVLCVHGHVPFLEVYAKRSDAAGHQPIRLTDLIEASLSTVDPCTFEVKRIGGKRWRLKAENSLKRDEWLQKISEVQESCRSELCLDDPGFERLPTDDLRTLLTSTGSEPALSRSQSVSSSESNLYSLEPVKKNSVPQSIAFGLLRPASASTSELPSSSPRSMSSIRSLPASSPRPIRGPRSVLDMPICAPRSSPSTPQTPLRGGVFGSSPQSPPGMRFSSPLTPPSRLEPGRCKKFVLDKPIPLPSVPEQHPTLSVDMVETCREFKANRISNSSSSNRGSTNSSNQENDSAESDSKPDIYGYYGILKSAKQDSLYYDTYRSENTKHKHISLVVSICTEGLKLVKALGKIWIVGWEPKLQRTVGGLLHFGDQVVEVNGKPVNAGSDLISVFHDCPAGVPVRLTVNPLPYGQVFVLRKPIRGNLNVGIVLHKGKNRIEAVEPSSVASMANLPSTVTSFLFSDQMVPSVITEIEDLPLDPTHRDGQALRYIDSIPSGESFNVVVHPRDLVKVLKMELKS